MVGLAVQRAQNADTNVIAACHQPGARSRAHRLRDIKVRKDTAFPRHPIEARRGVILGAKRSNVGVAHVVDVDDDEVGRRVLSEHDKSEKNQQRGLPE